MNSAMPLLPSLTPTVENLLAPSFHAPSQPTLTLSTPHLTSIHPKRQRGTRRLAGTEKVPSAKPSFLPGLDDPLAGLHSLQDCVATADLSGKGDHELVVCTIPDFANVLTLHTENAHPLPASTLKTYPPTLSNPPVPLLNPPAALQTFHSRTPLHTTSSHRPVLALASGPHIRIYESNSLPSSHTGLSPTFTFTLPPMSVNVEERKVWERMWDAVQGCWARLGDQMEEDEELARVFVEAVGVLKGLRWTESVRLTPRSEDFLAREGMKERIEVVKGCEGGIDYLVRIPTNDVRLHHDTSILLP